MTSQSPVPGDGSDDLRPGNINEVAQGPAYTYPLHRLGNRYVFGFVIFVSD